MAAISKEEGREIRGSEKVEEVKCGPPVHSQVLRIRKEETRIGEEIAEGVSSRQPDWDRLRLGLGSLSCSRSALRSSPLGNRSAIGSSSR